MSESRLRVGCGFAGAERLATGEVTAMIARERRAAQYTDIRSRQEREDVAQRREPTQKLRGYALGATPGDP